MTWATVPRYCLSYDIKSDTRATATTVTEDRHCSLVSFLLLIGDTPGTPGGAPDGQMTHVAFDHSDDEEERALRAQGGARCTPPPSAGPSGAGPSGVEK